MAVLSTGDRQLVSALTQRRWSADQTSCSITKAQLLAAVDATDQWIDDNAAAFNTALPVAARTNLTLEQKTLLFCFVALRRAGLSL